MRKLVAALTAVFALAAVAAAQDIEIGQGLVCDTQAQVERFVAVFTTDAETALAQVNAEAKSDPVACGIGPVAFIRGEKVNQIGIAQRNFAVTKIMVVGVPTAAGVMFFDKPIDGFTLFAIAGRPA
jgi:hypothetical protein